jgi:hypothetical protein
VRVLRATLLATVALGGSAQALPYIPGLQPGFVNLGTPASPTPSPTPTPTPSGPVPTLVPGTTAIGSWAATATPAVQGSGDTTPPVMAWIKVPRSGVTASDKRICVFAMHPPNSTEYSHGITNAMSKVRLIANNGTPVDITATTSANVAGYPLYCADLDQSAYGANAYTEIRAIGYPTNGTPMILQGDDSSLQDNVISSTKQGRWSLFVVANYTPRKYFVGGTGANDANSCTDAAHPCATPSGAKAKLGSGDYSNVEVCLTEGSWSVGSDSTYRTASRGWYTITACPGAAKANVKITGWGVSNSGTYVNYTAVRGVTMRGYNFNGPTTGPNAFWLDDVNWVNSSSGSCVITATTCSFPFNTDAGRIKGGQFFTNTLFSYFSNGPKAGILNLKVTIDTINADAFQNATTIISSTVRNTIWCCSNHPDFNQMFSQTFWNHVVVNNVATENNVFQAFFQSSPGGVLNNAVYADNQMDGSAGPTLYNIFNMSNGASNVYFLRNVLTGAYGAHGAPATSWHFVDNVCFLGAGGLGSSISGWTIRNSPTCQ